MRVLLDDVITEISRLIGDSKGIRDRVLLERALESLKEFKKFNEKKMV
mgnify:CR=1 FL=1